MLRTTLPKTIGATLLVLLALEGLVRIAGLFLALPGEERGGRTASDAWYRVDPHLGWRPAPEFAGEVYGAPRRFDADGHLDIDHDQVAEAAQRPTILILGDSRSFGNHLPVEATYAEVLDRELDGHAVVNASVPGYSAYQGRVLLATLLPKLRPEIVVAAFGFNDSRYVMSDRQRDGEAWFGRVYQARTMLERLIHLSSLLRLMAALAGVPLPGPSVPGQNLQRARTGGASAAGAVTIEELRARVTPGEFGEQIRAMERLATGYGARLVLLYLPDNPGFMPAELNDGMTAQQRGDPEAALAPLRAVAESPHWYSALARRQWVAALRAAGRSEEAARASGVPIPLRSLHGALPLHFDQEYRHAMRRVARETGATFCDATAALYAARDYFERDPCHFGARAHASVAAVLVSCMALDAQ